MGRIIVLKPSNCEKCVQCSLVVALLFINPYLTNGFAHRYHLGESTFIFRGIRSDF